MTRNLDMTALRSFVAVADTGGVTRAAGFLNLTQSAVSMQLKRLEDNLGISLLDRTARAVALTTAGEQLLSYARRMLVLNDEVMTRMTDTAFEGEVVLGVPSDIVYPAIPRILNRFAVEFPRMRVQLVSSNTNRLKAMFARGECDFILTTEGGCGPGGRTLVTLPLVWVGARGGNAHKARPLRLAFGTHCIFRRGAQLALDEADIPWETAAQSDTDRAIEATVVADLAVTALLEGTEPRYTEPVPAAAGLPALINQNINLYRAGGARGPAADAFADLVAQQYALCG
ncbi:LysR family transcriptional regulator [Profundibacterium mesophilum]|uniref:Transcriptional regulator LysR family protein n=1 Tax=Profundibacterium mesophilum KAUST100406-0324 TaxID=1037889 RepID=A0A921NS27_9RHOB|nr:LysR family transcriptional regulator [Profundibacterium mesophilum]KAF0675394.1 Transcriptional regulator LysR family protein [Profundibacterium mesophilum KAUST100406-0324]